MATKSVNENNNTSAPVGSGSDFPKHSLKAALRVANALEEMNSGNPMPPTDVAIAIGKSPGSSDLSYMNAQAALVLTASLTTHYSILALWSASSASPCAARARYANIASPPNGSLRRLDEESN